MVARPRVEQAGFAPSPSQAWKNQGKRVRAAEGGGLENRCAATPHRGFESHRFRRVKGPRTCRRQRCVRRRRRLRRGERWSQSDTFSREEYAITPTVGEGERLSPAGAGRTQPRTDDPGSGDAGAEASGTSGPEASKASGASTPASDASAPASGTSGSDICASASGSSKLRTERRKPRVITAR